MLFSLRNAISIAVLESLYAKAVARAERAEQRIQDLLIHNSNLIDENRSLKRQIDAERNAGAKVPAYAVNAETVLPHKHNIF